MSFVSYAFAALSGMTLVAYHLAHRSIRVQNAIVSAASLVFYGWFDWTFLGLLVMAAGANYAAAIGIEDLPRRRRPIVVAAIVGNLLLLSQLTTAPLEWAVSFEMSDLFRADLPTLRTAIERLAPDRVRLLITPAPQRWALPQALQNRSAAIKELTESLGLAVGDLLNTPAYLSTRNFAVETHLHESARPLFTRSVADALQDGARN